MKVLCKQKFHTVVSVIAGVLSVAFIGIIVSPFFLYAQVPPSPLIEAPDTDNFIEAPDTPFIPSQEPTQYLPAGNYTAGPDGVLSPGIGPGDYTVGPGGTANRVLPSTQSEAQAGAAAAAAEAARKNQADEMAKAFSCGFTNPKGCVAGLMDIVMWLAARTLWIAGVLLNITLDYTLNLNTLLEKLPIVDIGWKVLRDLANIVFIFITLWCGISITLGIGDGGKKAWGYLAQMVLVALFINFSLFITKAVVDVSNIAALHFYSLIVDPTKNKDWDSGLSEAFLYGLKLSTIYNSRQLGAGGAINTDASLIGSSAVTSKADLSFTNIILIGFFGSLFIIVAAWVFFAAAIMFIYRAVTLIFLMILSPLAFVGLILPGASGMAHAWWSKLWSQAFFAPLYLALAYIVVRTINTPGGVSVSTTDAGFAAAITGTGAGTVGVIFNFVILIGFMVACLVIAQSLGAKGSEMAMAGWQKIKGGAMGVVTGAGGLAARAGVRGFGTESFKDWASRNAATAKEKAGQASTPAARDALLAKSARWAGVAKSKWIPNLSMRKLDERWERSGGILGGQGAIGSILRAQTTKRAVDAKFGTKMSAQEAYEADETRISKLKDIEYGSDARKAADGLQPLRHEEHGLQDNLHTAQELLAEARKALAEAKKLPNTDTNKATKIKDAQTKVDALKGTGLIKALKELTDAKKTKDVAKITAAQAKVDAEKKKGGVEGAKLALEDFDEKNGAKIEQDMRKIATALARMSTEGFLNMQKSFFTIPEIMDITVLGADKYNALMASEHYTNPEKIEYSEARTERVKTQAVRLKEKNEWYLQDKKFWQEEKAEWDKKKSEIEDKKGLTSAIKDREDKDGRAGFDELQERLKTFADELKTLEATKGTAPVAIEWTKEKINSTQEAIKDLTDTVIEPAKAEVVTEMKKDGLVDVDGNSALREAPKASKWDNDELRKAMRNMNNPQEVLNYYRYARELIDIPPFVQTVKQGMWSKLRDSAEVDSFTKEKIRVDKRLYMQEASDFEFGLDPVMMKRWEEINAVAAQDFRDVLNDFVIKHSEQEYKDTYFRGGKLNEELKSALSSSGAEKLLKDFSEGETTEKERELRHSTGGVLMGEVLQNLANDEATLMNGTLRNLHWIKRELNRGLFSEFKGRDIDVKIPDIEHLIHSVGNMFTGNNELSQGNIDFIVWLTNERAGKEFVPYEQMQLSEKEQMLWEAIKALAKQRDDGLGSRFADKKAALQWLKTNGYHQKDGSVRSPWRTAGIKSRGETSDDAEFYSGI